MQVGAIPFGRSERFASSAVYELSPATSIFAAPSSARCYPAFVNSAGTSHLAASKTWRFSGHNMNLATELERLADALDGETGHATQISFASVAERIARNLSVRTDEVAILGISNRWQHLYFVVPEALKNVGFIPLSSKSALAARTTRESRPEIINDFTSVKHASVFEGIKLAAEGAEAIQKIISAPILSGDRVVGVIQISRKGTNPKVAGPDFTSDDLGKVVSLCNPLGKLLQRTLSD
jgi:hypothetical protein